MSSGTRIVIRGGGAIGAAIAYFTSRRGARSTVIERHAVAGAASGKSGGFLALDWYGGDPLDRLARRSFELHAELSAELGDPWGYRRLTTYGGYAADKRSAWLQKLDAECPYQVVLPRRQLTDDSEILNFLLSYAGKFDMYVEDECAAYVRYCFKDPMDAAIFRSRFERKSEPFRRAG